MEGLDVGMNESEDGRKEDGKLSRNRNVGKVQRICHNSFNEVLSLDLTRAQQYLGRSWARNFSLSVLPAIRSAPHRRLD